MLDQDNILWSSNEVAEALGQEIGSSWYCTGLEFDSRKVKKGSLFFAFSGKKLDGHNFISDAIKLGAVAVIVHNSFMSEKYNNKLIKVADVYKSLLLLASYARKRINIKCNVIAITGSAGKTSTKEIIKSGLDNIGETYANPDSYNNHVGVPYSLANMSRSSEFGIFEIGMNNANEIRKLSKLVKPNIVIITNVSEAHIGNFKSIKDVIKAKAEIFEGLIENGNILINRDFEYYNEIMEYSKNIKNINILTYGVNNSANICLVNRQIIKGGQIITALVDRKKYKYNINIDGMHQAINSLAVLGVLVITKSNIEKGINNLYKSIIPTGRGNKHNLSIGSQKSLLIDDSYNANPSSVIASLKSLHEIAKNNRKVLILGEMGELGKFSLSLHKNLFSYLISTKINLVIFVGKNTKGLYDVSKSKIECTWAIDSEQVIKTGKMDIIKPMDAILVKGSRYMKMEVIVNYLIAKYKKKEAD